MMVVTAILVAVVVALGLYQSARQSLAFPNLDGPVEQTVLPLTAPPPTSPEAYFNESTAGIAVLLADPNSSWLGIAHGLKSIGVPFRVVQSVDQALRHDVILVYPSIYGANTTPETLSALAEYVRRGHTLIAFSVIGGGMPALFGFETTRERNDLMAINFDSTFDPEFHQDAAEATIRLAALHNPVPMAGVSYHNLKHPAVATYDDGSAAITHNFFAVGDRTGHAYAIGFDIGHFILRAQNSRLPQLADTYVNDYQPKVDSLLRFLAWVYTRGSPEGIQLLPVPYNREFTALMTHDIDFTQSINNAEIYANLEVDQGITATYFIQTKYVTDYNDSRFFQQSSRPIIVALESMGMELASHTVAHTNELKDMPLGTGLERYPDYSPKVIDFTTVRGASIAGELRVSKFLLEALAPAKIVSFRPGHLSLPYSLPEMLQATGFKYSSSVTANSVLTHYPYRTNYSRKYDTELDVFEFPITIEDENGRLGDRIDQAIVVANKIGQHGGVVNVLIHTDVLDHKLEFERQFVAEFRDRAWFGTIAQFGEWWAVRDSAVVSVDTLATGHKRLRVAIRGAISGLSIRVPDQWVYQSGLADTRQDGPVVILGAFSEDAQLIFSGPD